MSEYFRICNMDRKELLSGAWFGQTSGLPGMLRPGDGLMTGLGVLLALSGSHRYSGRPFYGRWAGDRIAILGDYFHDTVAGQEVHQDIWSDIATQQDGWADISEHVRRLLETEWEIPLRAPLVDGGEPRSVLHADGTITAVPAPVWDDATDTWIEPKTGQDQP